MSRRVNATAKMTMSRRSSKRQGFCILQDFRGVGSGQAAALSEIRLAAAAAAELFEGSFQNERDVDIHIRRARKDDADLIALVRQQRHDSGTDADLLCKQLD